LAAVLFQPALMGPPRKSAVEDLPARRVAVFADEDEFEPVGRMRDRKRLQAEHQREDETVSR
jgi:hypothetical protein